MTFNGYMIRYDTWADAVRGSDASDKMKETALTVAAPLRTADGLLDSFELGLTLGELANHFSDAELADFDKVWTASNDLDRVPYVRTPHR